MAEGVLVLDAGGRIAECNPAAERILGSPGADLLTKGALVNPPLGVVHEDGSPCSWENFPAAVTLRTGSFQERVVLGLRRPEGLVVWLSINSAPIRRPDGEISGVLCSFSDITQSKQVEHALQRRLDEQEAIHQLSNAVAGAGTLEQVYEIAMTGVQRAAGAERAAVLLFDPDRVIRFKAWRGLSSSYRAAVEGHSPWNATERPAAPILIPDVERDPSLGDLRGAILAEGIRALGFVPLAAGNRLIGKFMIYYDRPHQFEDREIRFLETLSSHLGVAVERKQNEAALRRSEEQFRLLVEVASDIIYRTDASGRFRYVSPVALKVLEYETGDLIKQNYLTVVRPDWHEAARSFYTDQFARRVQSTYFELPLLSRSGREIWIGQHVRLIEQSGQIVGFQAIARDVTDRRRTEDALRESEERFRQLTETIDDVFWLTDAAKTEMIYLSPSFESVWGRPREPIYRNPHAWLDSVEPTDRPRVEEALPLQPTGGYDLEFRIIRPDGEVRWLRDRAFPLRDSGGRVYRIAGVCTDITAHRNLEDRLRQSQKMEAVGQLAGGVAHDFNNLLTVILGNASLLSNDPHLGIDGRGSVAEIASAADRAANLTRQLLTFSRRQVASARPIGLAEIIAGMETLLHRLLGEDALLALRLGPAIPMVRADPGMIEQVVMNLALNARDSMPGGGQVTLELDTVNLEASRPSGGRGLAAGRFVRLTVRDSGLGIPAEDLPHIFEPFFTTKEIGQGTGLGLATVFGIVEQHRGWIEVESEVGSGTTFRVLLPVAEAEDPAPVASDPPATVSGGTETILLVEDEPAVRRLAKIVLQRFGYHVIEADSGPAAQRLWPGIESKVDLLLVDLVMPGGMSGHDLALALRSGRPDLRVLYATGYSDEVVRRRFNFTPGRDFLQKPYSPEGLGAAVRVCLDGPVTEHSASVGR